MCWTKTGRTSDLIHGSEFADSYLDYKLHIAVISVHIHREGGGEEEEKQEEGEEEEKEEDEGERR